MNNCADYLTQDFITDIIQVVERQGDLARNFRFRAIGEKKSDGTDVTTIDKLIGENIWKFLRRSKNNYDIVYEEDTPKDIGTALLARGPKWVLDSLDGTREYFNKTGDGYAVMLSLVAPDKSGEMQPLFGIVHYPERGITYYTDISGKTHKREGGNDTLVELAPYPLLKRPRMAYSIVEESLENRQKYGLDFLHLIGLGVESVHSPSSGDRLYQMLEGNADMYTTGHSKIWDVAAPIAVLRGAGGDVRRLSDTGPSVPPKHRGKPVCEVYPPYFGIKLQAQHGSMGQMPRMVMAHKETLDMIERKCTIYTQNLLTPVYIGGRDTKGEQGPRSR